MTKSSCPSPCNVLLIGGGGREHALGWKLAQSPRMGNLWLTHPENAGLSQLGQACPVPLDGNTFRLSRWCDREDIHLVVVGPEGPLAEGLADELESETRRVFGPSKAGARLEADKAYAKDLMRAASIPTADAQVFNNCERAITWIESREEGMVVKASGLAAGKGVMVCDTVEESVDAVNRIMRDRCFGDAGATVIVEERLEGQEVSVLALTDGRTIWILDPCQDHKQVGEGDTGPNTGGMGAYCPTPLLDEDMLDCIEHDILVPIVDALKRDGVNYRGVLYAGLMLTPGGPKVLEFNCRFGDPETQPLMARLQSDLIELLWATATTSLAQIDDITFDDRTACTVVMCSGGYPGSYKKHLPITGIKDAESIEGVTVFHAGTRRASADTTETTGGRVLGVTALAADLQTARDLANQACARIDFEGAFYREDIGHRVLSHPAATPDSAASSPTPEPSIEPNSRIATHVHDR